METDEAILFQSMHGGSARRSGRSPVQRMSGHTSVQCVPPPKASSVPSSARTAQRNFITPPVCGVQPGKVLELRTSLGLMRARAILEEQRRDAIEMGQPSTGGSNGKGQLKTGRLQPLGVVGHDVITADQCFGVIPVNKRTAPGKLRPRSSMTPGVNSDLFQEQDGSGRGRVRVKKRSLSASVPRAIDTGQLLQIITSPHIGLAPQEEAMKGRNRERPEKSPAAPTHSEGHQILSPSESVSGDSGMREAIQLPPVARNSSAGITVEVKGVRKRRTENSHNGDCDDSERPLNSSQLHHHPLPGPAPSQDSVGLPQLTPSPSASPPKTGAGREDTESGAGREDTESGGEQTRTSKELTLRNNLRITSVVSLKEMEKQQQNPLVQKRKRHSSANLGGRLSLGWSLPQPIKPLRGGPVPTGEVGERERVVRVRRARGRSKSTSECEHSDGDRTAMTDVDIKVVLSETADIA